MSATIACVFPGLVKRIDKEVEAVSVLDPVSLRLALETTGNANA